MNKIIYHLFKYTVLLSLFYFNSFALGSLTTIQSGISIYSEYYPNALTQFKGTIIFENGSGTTIDEWKENKEFFNCVTQLGSVFLYDRSGLGGSYPDLNLSATNPLTAKLVSNRLLKLLKKLNIKPPYLIVAHSYGAMYVGYFTLKNSKVVKGLLLVDPVPKNFNFSTKLIQKHKKGLEEAKIKSASYIYKKYGGSEAEVAYQLLGFSESKNSIKNLGDINNIIPVIIISSTEMEKEHPLKENWYKNQKQWLNKNKQSQIYSVSSSHFIQIEQPQLVCDKIKDLLSD